MASTHAEAAKQIRKILKEAFPATKFQVRSRVASMMDAVDVDWVDGPLVKEVDALIGKFQWGHFDGLTDSTIYSNRRDDLPQVRFVCTHRKMSADMRATIFTCLCAKYDAAKAEDLIHQVFSSGSFENLIGG